ncbi:hypothetical protein CAPTEDRAFT_189947 [Capitella teleta]|uniref:Homeobox domain-containing protein n=1 Tax=Capitella teleta TaxID=283909 RepID=R7UAP6_CAPTE|nr:hypothetical protein CAPTEDRAFT_189947 [Capitella teleta]|eukprot:ELU03044.1 hypothetical protein CAPTEDRAFT_189947 [Capitella teleta]
MHGSACLIHTFEFVVSKKCELTNSLFAITFIKLSLTGFTRPLSNMTADHKDMVSPWASLWNSTSDECVGWVPTIEEVTNIVTLFQEHTQRKFITSRRDKGFEIIEGAHPAKKKVHFEDKILSAEGERKPIILTDKIPFMKLGVWSLVCEFGRDKHLLDKARLQGIKTLEDQAQYLPLKNRRKSGTSKKCNCPARIVVKNAFCFSNFKLEFDSARHRRAMVWDVCSCREIVGEHRFYVRFPVDNEHNSHGAQTPAEPLQHNKLSVTRRVRPGGKVKTVEQHNVLCDFYNRGMTSPSVKDLVAQASLATGITQREIGAWIQRQKKRHAPTNQPTEIEKESPPIGVQYLHLQGGELDRINTDDYPYVAPLQTDTELDRERKAEQAINRIHTLSEELQRFGYECFSYISHPSKMPCISGTPKAMGFIEEKHETFVTDLEHTLYSEKSPIVGKSEAQQVPYRAIETGVLKLVLRGLEDDIEVTDPKHYDKNTLRKILGAEDFLEMVAVVTQNVSEELLVDSIDKQETLDSVLNTEEKSLLASDKLRVLPQKLLRHFFNQLEFDWHLK